MVYNRRYNYIGSIPFGEFERLLKECNVIQICLNYLGGENEPDFKSEGVELTTSGHICGDAFWIASKEDKLLYNSPRHNSNPIPYFYYSP